MPQINLSSFFFFFFIFILFFWYNFLYLTSDIIGI
nr:ATP synthase F0 subunit 8 [Pyura mirabilis]UPP55921.1 ATP synthase F0 subunit 8 [Pyura mirabilis]